MTDKETEKVFKTDPNFAIEFVPILVDLGAQLTERQQPIQLHARQHLRAPETRWVKASGTRRVRLVLFTSFQIIPDDKNLTCSQSLPRGEVLSNAQPHVEQNRAYNGFNVASLKTAVTNHYFIQRYFYFTEIYEL